MNRQLNQKFKRIFRNKLLKWLIIFIIPLLLLSFIYPLSQNEYILKVDKKMVQGVVKSYIAIGQRVVGDFPCGEAIGIALQDVSRYIFSAASPFNATLVPGSDHDILFPGDGTFKTAEENRMTYSNAFDRIDNLEIGIMDKYYGKSWVIASDELQKKYPTNTFDIQFEGKEEKAFDYSNMFYEMVISIQHLSKENKLLKDRLTNLEQSQVVTNVSLLHESTNTNHIEITPNPANNGQLIINYKLGNNIKDAELMINDLNGRTVQIFELNTTNTLQVEQVNLSAGAYLYHLVYDGRKTLGQKLIIQ